MAELRFAVTMLSPDLQPVDQLKFLLAGDEDTFAKLQQRFPGDKILDSALRLCWGKDSIFPPQPDNLEFLLHGCPGSGVHHAGLL